MNLNKVFTVYRKELLDLLRDRRTVITSFVLPLILYPLLMIGFSSMMSRQEMKLEEEEATVYIQNNLMNETAIEIENTIAEVETFQIMESVTKYKRSTYLQLVEENSIQALVEISDSTTADGLQQFIVTVSYNKSDDKSSLTYDKIYRVMEEIEEKIVSSRLERIKVNPDILDAVNVLEDNIAPPEKMIGFALGKFLPYLLIILTVSGASVIASDLVAGEKERGTLETILVSAARRNELVVGKYLTIITISIITVLCNLFSMYFSFSHIISQAGAEVTNIQLPLGNFALILILMLPLITFFSAILLSISTYSRNIKEAQSYQMPLIFGSIMLSMVSFLPGFELNAGFALIPIVNFSLMIRDIMLSDFSLNYFLLIIGYTIILDIVLIGVSIKLFNSESVLFRTEEEKSLKFWGKGKKDIFNTQFVMLVYFVLLLALYYLGTKWQTADIMKGLIKTQIFLILLPVLLILRVSKTNIKSTIRLNKTKTMNFVWAIIAVIPALLIVAVISQVINLFFPISESYLEGMKNFLTAQQGGFWFSIFVIGVLPGICEETLFRGYIIRGFEKQGIARAIVISGILFGIYHLDPFRLVPASLLGMWMGFLLLKTNSIFVPMFAHFVNNSLAVILNTFEGKIPILDKLLGQEIMPYWYIIPAAAIMYFVYVQINKTNQKPIKILES
ncbi:MAG: ABC transporter permease subunit [Candidatus Cloacimonetes bacterium]|nr:ABC transporter permease subunit [Candidatus Cloacimonadota bacterium]MCF7813287.1 ABC transporter permease subunit [Candidatus Cloacimonadota bacterium]MCF7867362.1 ABC transporter permease subunit [Candidatus Cloacimonadota bacterium]MCF7882796.1 ABC transporter permease subunit [Candidatus Cloacimonadota bacterium]